MDEWKNKPDSFWRDRLSAEQYAVCRQKATERPFSGEYNGLSHPGKYYCVCCGELLFDSGAKFDSGSGWPSFFAPAAEQSIAEQEDRSHGMLRIEISCENCGSHLGHVFEDGPAPSGLRYCVNSVSLAFVEEEIDNGK